MIPVTKSAVQLFHQAQVALGEIESYGIKVDLDYLSNEIKTTAKKIIQMEEKLKTHKIWKLWKRRFGTDAKIGSRPQLGKIIFDELGYKRSGKKTAGDEESNDFAAFELVKEPWLKGYYKMERMKKARSTYLLAMEREVRNGYFHPIPNLHTAITYRSSYDRTNIQNFPVRDEDQKEIVRRAIIAPDRFRIGEIDYGGIEVCISACYHQDPKMIKYIIDPTTDMHRDMSMQCYMLDEDPNNKEYWKQGSGKQVRYCAKNKFVFPEFYGSYFKDCSKSLWEAIGLLNLETSDGIKLKKYLKSKGIKGLGNTDSDPDTGRLETKKGTFIHHIRQVEEDFWNNRFKVYKQWKKDWWNDYIRRGEFPFLTGFVGRGLYDRKQVCNSPIQGSAFHCLLWSLIKLHKKMKKKKMRSYIIAEVHDSLLIYFHRKEVDDVLHMAHKIMTKDIIKHWPWIVVPLSIEAEIAPEGGSWNDKVVYPIAA